MNELTFNRRSVLQAVVNGSVAAGLGGATEAKSADGGRDAATKRREYLNTQVDTTFLNFDDPVEEFKAHFRIERDLVPLQGTKLTC